MYWAARNFIVLLFCVFSCSDAFNVKAKFPSSTSSQFPRLRLLGTFPPLHEFTVCVWIKSFNFVNEMRIVLSYANSRSNNAIYLSLVNAKNSTNIRLHIAGPSKDFGCSGLNWKTATWYHICASWFGPDGSCKVYVNGRECVDTAGTKGIISPGKIIIGDGVLIIGQEQDAIDSSFDPNQAWIGDITDIHIWDEVLHRNQISEAGRCKGKRKPGNVFSWMKTPIAAMDGVIISETELCEI